MVKNNTSVQVAQSSVNTTANAPVNAPVKTTTRKQTSLKNVSEKTTESVPVTTQPLQTSDTLTTTESVSRTPSRFYGTLSTDLTSQLQFYSAFDDLQRRFTESLSELKALRYETRRLQNAYEHDLQRVQKSKRKRAGNVEPTGFVKESLLPNDLADLIGVAHGTKLSTPELTKRFYRVLNERNLYHSKDHRIFLPDAQMRSVFELSEDVNKSSSHNDENGFNFTTLQKHIARCLRRVNNGDVVTTQTASVTASASAPVTPTASTPSAPVTTVTPTNISSEKKTVTKKSSTQKQVQASA